MDRKFLRSVTRPSICFHITKTYIPVGKEYVLLNFYVYISGIRGPRWSSWLRHCATSQKVAGSIPDGVIGIFH